MKNILLILTVILSYASTQAQTKVIFHKSHSGSKATFEKALGSKTFDLETSDFGLPDWADSRNTIDSVIFVNKKMQVVVINKHCVEKDGRVNFEKPCKVQRDTLINHPIFSQQHNLKGVQYRIRRYYDFRNHEHEIAYTNYDDENPEWIDHHPHFISKITYLNKDTVLVGREEYLKNSAGLLVWNDPKIWTDTLLTHPLLFKRYDLDLIQKELRKYYTVGKPVDDWRYVGYKRNSRKAKKAAKKENKEIAKKLPISKKEDKKSKEEVPVLLPSEINKKEARKIRREKKKEIQKEKEARIKAAKKATKEKIKSQEEDTGYRRPSDDVSPKSTIPKPRPKLVSQESTKENTQAKKTLPWWGLFGMSSIGLSLLIAFIKR